MSTNTVNSYALLGPTGNQYIPLKLLQSSSAEVARGKAQPGKLMNTMTGEEHDFIDFVILGVRKEFRVWHDSGLSKYPECVSNDMKTLIHLNPETGEKVEEEPLETSAAWQNRFQEKNSRTQYFFLAAMPDNPMPVFFRASGLSFRRATRFLNKARARNKELYSFVTRVSVEEESTKFGKKYVLDFQITDKPVPDVWEKKAQKTCQEFIENTRNLLPDGR